MKLKLVVFPSFLFWTEHGLTFKWKENELCTQTFFLVYGNSSDVSEAQWDNNVSSDQ